MAAEIINEGDHQAIIDEKIAVKLLRLSASAQEGLIMTDYPNVIGEAEVLEEYRGGLNAFVHISLPKEVLVDIEETKVVCQDCGTTYYKDSIIDNELGVRIERHIPDDGHCFSCGSTNLAPGSDPMKFEEELETYQEQKEGLLSFYNDLGLLVDFEPRRGYEDYDKLKR